MLEILAIFELKTILVMSVYIGNKCNVSICKIVLVSLLFCNLSAIHCQSRAVKEAEKKKENLKNEQDDAAIKKHNELLDKHFKNQGKKTQLRMKKNKKLIDKYYKRKTRQTLWQRLFPRKKNKKYKH